MRAIVATVFLLLGLQLPLQAAVFQCTFNPPPTGSTTPQVCSVDSTKITPCRQAYSPTLFALCQGGVHVPGTVSHLGCYFATPDNAASLETSAGLDPEAFAKATASQPGTHAVAMQWLPTTSTPGNNMGLLYTDPDSKTTYIILCNVQP
jgi:hypothetical protein